MTLLLLAGWVLVVVVGAGARPDESPLLGVSDLGLILVIPLVLLALVGLGLLIYLKPDKNEEFVAPEKGKRSILALVVFLLLFAAWRPNIFEAMNELAEEQQESAPAPVDVTPIVPEPPAETVAEATDLLLLALGVAVVAGVWFLARMRARASVEPLWHDDIDEELEAELIVAMDEASAELDGTDPRTGVLNAYASLERVLASRERRRLVAETPTEHLRRVLASLRVDPAPLIELGSLYELARFSNQDISEDQQRDARLALDRARSELAALV